MVVAGKLVPVSRGCRDLSLSCSWGRPAPAEAGHSIVDGTLSLVEVGRLVRVSRGSRDLPLSCSWRGRSWVDAGALVPVVVGTLVPDWSGLRLVYGSRLRQGGQSRFPGEARTYPHTAKTVDTTTGRERPLLTCTSYVRLIEVLASQGSQDQMAYNQGGLMNTVLLEPLPLGGGPGFPEKPGPKAVVARSCI